MITVKAIHHYVVTFDGDSANTLRDLCEIARIALERSRQETYAFAGMTKEQRGRMRVFIDEIFEKTSVMRSD